MSNTQGSAARTVEGQQFAEVLRHLHSLSEEVRELRAAVDAQAHRTDEDALTRADRTFLRKLLPAVAGVKGSDEFTCRELYESREPALRLVLRKRKTTGLGQVFARAVKADEAIDGWLVQRVGKEVKATLWRVVQVTGGT